MSQWGKSGCSDWLAMWLPKLKPAQFAVLFAMTRYADDETGEFFASEVALADDTGLSKGYINDMVDELVAAGPIIVKVPGSRGRGRSTVYALVDDPDALARHVSDVNAKRKARREKSEANRNHDNYRSGAAKAPMRAKFPQHGFPARDARYGIDVDSPEWKASRERHLEQERVQTWHRNDRARRDVLTRGRAILGKEVDDLILGLFQSYGRDVEDTVATIEDAAKKPNPRGFIAEIIESRRP